jgi:hypothetical protein
MAYTLHPEWIDGTFEETPTASFGNKRKALRIAKLVAADSSPEVVCRILVCVNGEATVAAFKV